MKMDDGFITTKDLDWFAMFSDGYLGHFTSGGVDLLPQKVKSSFEDYEVVYEWFSKFR